jgi:VWFA-related protein
MRVVRAVLLLASLTFLGQPIPAQNSSQPEPVTTIRATAGEVLLDMVVRDKHHKPVTDLRAEEVEVYEDGVRQDVKHFRLVGGAEELQSERESVQTASASDKNGSTLLQPQQRLKQPNFVSVVLAPIAPLNREFAREAVLDFLKSDSLPNTFVTVYTASHGLTLVQPYTADKTILTAAVDKVARGTSGGGGPTGSTAIASSAVATTLSNTASASPATSPIPSATDPMMQQFSGAIVTSPLWARNSAATDASTNLGSAIEAQALLSLATRFDDSEGMQTIDALKLLVRSQERLPGRKVVIYLSDGIAFPAEREDQVEGLISLANRSGVTFYTLDTRGLSTESSITPGLASLDMSGAESRQKGPVTTQNPAAAHREVDDIAEMQVSNRQLNMRTLAESTGGFAVTNTNQIAEPMQRVMEDIRSHYELSYAPKSTVYDGHFRKIEVRLVRPKLTVQTRKGYYALPTLNGEALQPFESSALEKINTRPVPADLAYDASLMKFRANENLVEYMIAFEVPLSGLKPIPVPKSDRVKVEASLFAIVRNSSGEVVDKISRELWRDIPAQGSLSAAANHIFYTQPLVLPRGNYSVETVVTDEQSGKAAVHRLAVPRDTGSELRLSSLEIVNRAEPLNRERDPLNPFELDNVRIVPELGDSVSAGSPVTMYFVLYPAKLSTAPSADVMLEVLRDGTTISRQQLKTSETRPDGSVPMVFRISPGPGSYALIITARQGNLVAESSRSMQVE